MKKGDCYRSGLTFMRVDSVSPLRYSCINFWDNGIDVHESSDPFIFHCEPTDEDVYGLLKYANDVVKGIRNNILSQCVCKKFSTFKRGDIVVIYKRNEIYVVESNDNNLTDTVTGSYIKITTRGYSYGYGTIDIYFKEGIYNFGTLLDNRNYLSKDLYLQLRKVCAGAEEILQMQYNY